jgi:hypothetical protein
MLKTHIAWEKLVKKINHFHSHMESEDGTGLLPMAILESLFKVLMDQY